ncbi:hypothetical protein ACRW9N_13145 [Listeria aquatica]|uniref:hypothetical protein n=1 Tax=Listeria aquatica TaxID=1494960 RepID=UPI003EF5C956
MAKEGVKGQNIIFCPNCGENKVLNMDGASSLALFLLGCVLFLFIVTIPVAIGIWIYIYRKHKKGSRKRQFSCQACKHTFFVEADTASKYDEAIK